MLESLQNASHIPEAWGILVDTGAATSVAPQSFASDIELSPAPSTFKLTTATGKEVQIYGLRKVGRLTFIHLQCWEVPPFCRSQRQRHIKIRVLRAQDFYTLLALKTAKGRHLQALEVYKNQSPKSTSSESRSELESQLCGSRCAYTFVGLGYHDPK